MSNSFFRFKQFTIEQDGCAMKVGTDGCLLGSWFNCAHSKRILDIGCGTGLISIMAAQRCNAHITGVEIDGDAARKAAENVGNCRWHERIEIKNADIFKFEPDGKYDTIVSNPPYFVNSMKCDDSSRTLARHSDSMQSDRFFHRAKELLSTDGRVSVIIPQDIRDEWCEAACNFGFFPSRIAYIKTTPRKVPKRVLIEFSQKGNLEVEENCIVLETSPGVYSDEARMLLRDFYLKIE